MRREEGVTECPWQSNKEKHLGQTVFGGQSMRREEGVTVSLVKQQGESGRTTCILCSICTVHSKLYESSQPCCALSQITMPVRVLQLLGVKILIVTNASGGLNEKFNMGDIMVLSDHINMVGMTGFNPLIGENEDRWAVIGNRGGVV